MNPRATYTLKEWKHILRNRTTEQLKKRLQDELETIAFLESIYRGANNVYCSDEVANEALKDRQALCQLTGAIYSMLAEREQQ